MNLIINQKIKNLISNYYLLLVRFIFMGFQLSTFVDSTFSLKWEILTINEKVISWHKNHALVNIYSNCFVIRIFLS